MPTATIHSLAEFRRRRAFRRCGTSTRPRPFVWLAPHTGSAVVALFRPTTAVADDIGQANMVAGNSRPL